MRSSQILVSKKKGNIPMLMTIAILLILLYALGLITSYTMGGLIHILLVVAVVALLVRLIQGRRVL
jgi:low affinity Fe/Cu permease